MIERLNEVICIAPWLELDLGCVIAGWEEKERNREEKGKQTNANREEYWSRRSQEGK